MGSSAKQRYRIIWNFAIRNPLKFIIRWLYIYIYNLEIFSSDILNPNKFLWKIKIRKCTAKGKVIQHADKMLKCHIYRLHQSFWPNINNMEMLIICLKNSKVYWKMSYVYKKKGDEVSKSTPGVNINSKFCVLNKYKNIGCLVSAISQPNDETASIKRVWLVGKEMFWESMERRNLATIDHIISFANNSDNQTYFSYSWNTRCHSRWEWSFNRMSQACWG